MLNLAICSTVVQSTPDRVLHTFSFLELDIDPNSVSFILIKGILKRLTNLVLTKLNAAPVSSSVVTDTGSPFWVVFPLACRHTFTLT